MLQSGLFSILTTALLTAQSGNQADVVLLGGKILILDTNNREAQALAIRERHIVELDTDQDMRKLTVWWCEVKS